MSRPNRNSFLPTNGAASIFLSTSPTPGWRSCPTSRATSNPSVPARSCRRSSRSRCPAGTLRRRWGCWPCVLTAWFTEQFVWIRCKYTCRSVTTKQVVFSWHSVESDNGILCVVTIWCVDQSEQVNVWLPPLFLFCNRLPHYWHFPSLPRCIILSVAPDDIYRTLQQQRQLHNESWSWMHMKRLSVMAAWQWPS